MVTALYQVGTTLAYSIGSAIGGAVYNNMLPTELAKHVPGQYDAASALGDIYYVMALPEEQFQGAITAYGNVQQVFAIIGLCLGVLAAFFACFLRNFGLSDEKADIVDTIPEEVVRVSTAEPNRNTALDVDYADAGEKTQVDIKI